MSTTAPDRVTSTAHLRAEWVRKHYGHLAGNPAGRELINLAQLAIAADYLRQVMPRADVLEIFPHITNSGPWNQDSAYGYTTQHNGRLCDYNNRALGYNDTILREVQLILNKLRHIDSPAIIRSHTGLENLLEYLGHNPSEAVIDYVSGANPYYQFQHYYWNIANTPDLDVILTQLDDLEIAINRARLNRGPRYDRPVRLTVYQEDNLARLVKNARQAAISGTDNESACVLLVLAETALDCLGIDYSSDQYQP